MTSPRPCWRAKRSLEYLQSGHGGRDDSARERIYAYLDELRTTQRHPIYRALQHPLYPILRKIERKHEHLHHVVGDRTRAPDLYASNHKSHTDYLVEPLVLDDNGIRPPLIAAGINLFGGPLGLIHRHVTGAIPIRRNTKDPAYLVTLKAYVAEMLKRHDLFFYPEGGRSYSGELKSTKTGLIHAALHGELHDLVDPSDRDRLRSRARGSRPRAAARQEAPAAVRSRAGRDGALRGRLPLARLRHLRRADSGRRLRSAIRAATSLELTRLIARAHRRASTRCCRRAVFAAAMRPSITRRDLEARIDQLIEELAAKRANLGVTSGREAVDEAAEPLETRGIIVVERGRFRVRDRNVLRYYARTIEHLLAHARPRRIEGLLGCIDRRPPRLFHVLAGSSALSTWPRATACGRRRASRGGSSPAKRSTKPSTRRAAIEARGFLQTLDFLGESVATPRGGRRRHARIPAHHRRDRRSPASSAISRSS